MILVIGPPDSGKSEIAEQLTQEYPDRRLYYLATMKIMDEEGRKRVARHRKQRSGRGFTTIELTRDLTKALSFIDDPDKAVVLLECVANLVANEMYDDPALSQASRSGAEGEKEFSKAVAEEIEALSRGVFELIAVSAVYGPEDSDDKETRLYKKLIEMVNITLKDRAESVIETGKG